MSFTDCVLLLLPQLVINAPAQQQFAPTVQTAPRRTRLRGTTKRTIYKSLRPRAARGRRAFIRLGVCPSAQARVCFQSLRLQPATQCDGTGICVR